MIVVPASGDIVGALVERPAVDALTHAVAMARAVRDGGAGVVADVMCETLGWRKHSGSTGDLVGH
ncbi:hypothetical protein QRX50_19900 [Amycolatopsis carbonis]|uniref:Uncharacterized protein n=1 Tax=Amycolatopsis carbonis TaxID=715471 RepID=A0A9Y2N1D7_9PSEU|nr:hypothetical protein [Amycolatopsis sp. 2-15]WIX82872.1 hypothetical protein QRX50_19900 [Amycolatopsis sp. 2-15]